MHLYVCGPGGFIQHVLDTARAQGRQENCLHREYFAVAPVDSSNDGCFSIKIASTGQVVEVPADETVVKTLERHGIEITMSCEQGICSTFLTRVLKGVPEHRDLFLTEEEQACWPY
jgi:vanillate O-demethylase ferredoxin subunit